MPIWLAFAGLGVLGIGLVDDTARRAQGTAKTLAPALALAAAASLVWAWKKK